MPEQVSEYTASFLHTSRPAHKYSPRDTKTCWFVWLLWRCYVIRGIRVGLSTNDDKWTWAAVAVASIVRILRWWPVSAGCISWLHVVSCHILSLSKDFYFYYISLKLTLRLPLFLQVRILTLKIKYFSLVLTKIQHGCLTHEMWWYSCSNYL